MRLTDDFKDEIRARVRMSDLVGRKIQLKRQGREFAGLSPFKKEKTPSFFVNDEKKFYHCFASGEHGDAFDWLMKMEGLSFMEAAEQLASIAGIPLPKADPEAAKKAEASKSLIEWMELAQRFFSRHLRSGAGADARHYLERRGYGPAEWETYEIGFAPDSRTALKDELIAAGAKPDELIDCGLLIAPDDGGAPYDRFRGRIMFAIRDPRERLVAFGGRAMSANARAKYLNSPETPIFHKGHNLYRYPQARKAAANPKSGARGLIVAEGYFDAIALARAGIEHAVAPLGTALGEDQMQLLWRAGGEPTLCFDGDNAGRMAANRAAERALPLLEPERTLRFVFLPEGKDPDDMLRDEGASALAEAWGIRGLWRRFCGISRPKKSRWTIRIAAPVFASGCAPCSIESKTPMYGPSISASLTRNWSRFSARRGDRVGDTSKRARPWAPLPKPSALSRRGRFRRACVTCFWPRLNTRKLQKTRPKCYLC